MKKLTPEQIRQNAELDYLVYEIVDTVCDTIKSCGGEVGANVPGEARIAVRKVLVKEQDRQRRIKAMMRFDTHVQAAVWTSPKKESAQENRAEIAARQLSVYREGAEHIALDDMGPGCPITVVKSEARRRDYLAEELLREILNDYKFRFHNSLHIGTLAARADYARIIKKHGAAPLIGGPKPDLGALRAVRAELRLTYPDYPLMKGKNNG